MSSLRTTPRPLNVGANTSVFRGIGNFENISRGTPEMVASPCAAAVSLTRTNDAQFAGQLPQILAGATSLPAADAPARQPSRDSAPVPPVAAAVAGSADTIVASIEGFSRPVSGTMRCSPVMRH